MIEAFKQDRLGFGNLMEVAFSTNDLIATLLVAEEAEPVIGVGMPERVYALVHQDKYTATEKIIVLCRIARLKKQFEEQSR